MSCSGTVRCRIVRGARRPEVQGLVDVGDGQTLVSRKVVKSGPGAGEC